jgi:hypothetical protein
VLSAWWTLKRPEVRAPVITHDSTLVFWVKLSAAPPHKNPSFWGGFIGTFCAT